MNEKECVEQMAMLSGNDREGANRVVAARVNGYWAERGKRVNARVENKQVYSGGRNYTLSVVVSDTLNGLPK